MFAYDASSGAVSGVATPGEQGRTLLTFDPEQTYIPSLDWKTTRVLGLPIPPPLRIEITTRELSVRVFSYRNLLPSIVCYSMLCLFAVTVSVLVRHITQTRAQGMYL